VERQLLLLFAALRQSPQRAHVPRQLGSSGHRIEQQNIAQVRPVSNVHQKISVHPSPSSVQEILDLPFLVQFNVDLRQEGVDVVRKDWRRAFERVRDPFGGRLGSDFLVRRFDHNLFSRSLDNPGRRVLVLSSSRTWWMEAYQRKSKSDAVDLFWIFRWAVQTGNAISAIVPLLLPQCAMRLEQHRRPTMLPKFQISCQRSPSKTDMILGDDADGACMTTMNDKAGPPEDQQVLQQQQQQHQHQTQQMLQRSSLVDLPAWIGAEDRALGGRKSAGRVGRWVDGADGCGGRPCRTRDANKNEWNGIHEDQEG
jgi:hypothetical protein